MRSLAIEPSAPSRRSLLHAAEDAAASVVLAAMVTLPLVEILLRPTRRFGISAAPLIVQHLGLVLGMLGGVIAAREGRLLALSTLGDRSRSGAFNAAGRVVAAVVGAAVVFFLAAASWRFVAAERHFARTLVYGLPVWAAELVLPIGFAVIAIRIVWRESDRWTLRLAIALGAASAVALASTPAADRWLFAPAFAALTVAVVFGAPAFVALGGTALLLFWRVH